MLTLDMVYSASYKLKEVIRRTDLIPSNKISDKCNVFLKTENLQVTGSFKVRGAYYKISQLSDEERQGALSPAAQETTLRALLWQLQRTASSPLSACPTPLLSPR